MRRRVVHLGSLMIASFIGACSSDPDPVDTGPTIGSCKSALNWELWIARTSTNDVKIVNGPRFQERVNVDLTPTGLTEPHAVSFDYAAIPLRAFVSMKEGIAFVDAKTRMLSGQTLTNTPIDATTLRPGSEELWAAAGTAKSVLILDATSRAVTSSITLATEGAPEAIVFSANGAKAYVATRDSIVEIDAAAKTVLGTWDTGQGTRSFAISPDDKTIYATNDTTNTISKVDLAAADHATAVMPFAAMVGGASSVTIGKSHVISTAPADGKVLFFDAMGVKATELAITGMPAGVVVSPDCARAYVLEVGAGALTEIDATKMTIKGSMNLGGGSPISFAIAAAPSDM